MFGMFWRTNMTPAERPREKRRTNALCGRFDLPSGRLPRLTTPPYKPLVSVYSVYSFVPFKPTQPACVPAL
eukprot:1186991-Prorocentrum_minimum.AAC.3